LQKQLVYNISLDVDYRHEFTSHAPFHPQCITITLNSLTTTWHISQFCCTYDLVTCTNWLTTIIISILIDLYINHEQTSWYGQDFLSNEKKCEYYLSHPTIIIHMWFLLHLNPIYIAFVLCNISCHFTPSY
jgi:hypothetical protein